MSGNKKRFMANSVVACPFFRKCCAETKGAFQIKLAFLLTLVDETTFQDLEVVRAIRNHFAHEYGRADFNDTEVARLTRSLKSSNQALKRLGSSSDFDDAHNAGMPGDGHKERARFILAASEIVNALEAKIRSLSKQAGNTGKSSN